MTRSPQFAHAPVDLRALGEKLATLAQSTAADGPWQSGAFEALASSGLLAGFIASEDGGTGMTEGEITAALVVIAERCLTTALALTQWSAAVRLIGGGPLALRQEMLPALARGESVTTVGISQLTTSRRHLCRPVLTATREGDAWRLDGICPWVTGGDSARTIVTGASTDDGQLFFVISTAAAGLSIGPPLTMLALSGSRTSTVRFAGVRPVAVLGGPASGGARAGGLSTSALAIGAARASSAMIAKEAVARPGLAGIATEFASEIDVLQERLMTAARQGTDAVDRDRLRADANSLVIRAAQGALTAAKGAGFVTGHPVERLARESLFFLVWSCPQAVADAFLCDLTAG